MVPSRISDPSERTGGAPSGATHAVTSPTWPASRVPAVSKSLSPLAVCKRTGCKACSAEPSTSTPLGARW
eukprot:7749480-Alexandrium_andersonii.AAC.1